MDVVGSIDAGRVAQLTAFVAGQRLFWTV